MMDEELRASIDLLVDAKGDLTKVARRLPASDLPLLFNNIAKHFRADDNYGMSPLTDAMTPHDSFSSRTQTLVHQMVKHNNATEVNDAALFLFAVVDLGRRIVLANKRAGPGRGGGPSKKRAAENAGGGGPSKKRTAGSGGVGRPSLGCAAGSGPGGGGSGGGGLSTSGAAGSGPCASGGCA